MRKGTCANHIRDVAKLFTGAQLTLNARNEDEMDPDLIMQKVSSVGSAYSFKEPRMHQEGIHKINNKINSLLILTIPEKRGPVGTNYERVIPAKEINSKDRDSFWKKEEEEERRRVVMEKERTQQLRAKEEQERQLREAKECQERERRTIEFESLSPPATQSPTKITTAPKALIPVAEATSPSRNTQADEMRKARNTEAKELIGSRVGTAKAIFSQNSASGQMMQKTNAPAKPVRNSIAQRINTLNNPMLAAAQSDEALEKPPRRMVTTAPEQIESIVEQSKTEEKTPVAPVSGVDVQKDVVVVIFVI